MKNLLIPAGIEPATYRFVAQQLNHCATADPLFRKYSCQISWTSVYGKPPYSKRKDGRTDRLTIDRHTHMTKLIVAFRNFSISPTSSCVILALVIMILALRMSFNKTTPLDRNCCVSIALCYNTGFIITFGQLYFKQPSAARSKWLT